MLENKTSQWFTNRSLQVSEAELQIEDLADSCSICTNFSKPEDVTAFPLKAVKKKPKDLVTVTCVVAVRITCLLHFSCALLTNKTAKVSN